MRSKRDHYYLLFIFVIILIVFFPTFFNDFQRGWDDTWQLLENPYVLDSSWYNIKYHFAYFWEGQYSPVNTLAYIVVYELFGFNALAFHALCLLFHVLNVFLVNIIIKDVLTTCKPNFSARRIAAYTFFATIIFAIHPLQVESVAWISASKIVLYAFFTLAALWCYIKYIHTSKWIWLFLVTLAYTLSFGSKEQAIILPLNLLLFDYVYGRFKGIGFKKPLVFKRVVLEKIPLFVQAYLFWYFSRINNLGNINVADTYPLYQRLLFGMHSISEYIFRSMAPVKLYYFYFYPIGKGGTLPLYFWGYPVLAVIIGAFVWNNFKKKNRIIVFGFFFFLINILLVLHILPMPRDMITADRYMYLSIVGLALIAIWLIHYVMVRFTIYKGFVKSLIAIYITFLGAHTFIRTQAWKDSEVMKNNVNEIIERRKALNQPGTNYPLIPDQDE